MRPTWPWILLTMALATGHAYGDCPSPGQWWQADGAVGAPTLLAQAARQQVVLLGEQHDVEDHHRWQLHTLAGLHALREDMVVGLEMLPRSAQPVLDRWVAGELTETELLADSRWDDAWGVDAELYLPILHFARLQAIPLVALNITPELRQRLVQEGFDRVPADQRYGIPTPLPASSAYQQRLTEVFEQHGMGQGDPAMLARFTQAQLTWDTAMAHGLAGAVKEGALAVGLMGLGHVTYGHGVEHQLEGMGIRHTLSLLPWDQAECRLPDPALADAVFVLPPALTHEPTN
ncbi:ChaN family lipoprotein [Vreelandella piezotolerans]|uniref:ChaN family lipoprotein n=1 Tax=Vreelandella piezotolerans TaxID=2609667 RepID=UPI003790431E|tara:strand:+ start:2358 stop:3227 length:870 start_codon:yes stop_codon:yes gene_type:complete